MEEWTPDPPSLAWPLTISLLLALLCPLVAIFYNPFPATALILVWFPSLIYGLIKFRLRGLWFLIGLPIALLAPASFFIMLCNAEPGDCGGWAFAPHFAPFW
jgi:hypothetical protein